MLRWLGLGGVILFASFANVPDPVAPDPHTPRPIDAVDTVSRPSPAID